MTIYLLAITFDDGATWRTLSCLGFFTDKDEAQREANKRNLAVTQDLTRYEIKESKSFPVSTNCVPAVLKKTNRHWQ